MILFTSIYTSLPGLKQNIHQFKTVGLGILEGRFESLGYEISKLVHLIKQPKKCAKIINMQWKQNHKHTPQGHQIFT